MLYAGPMETTGKGGAGDREAAARAENGSKEEEQGAAASAAGRGYYCNGGEEEEEEKKGLGSIRHSPRPANALCCVVRVNDDEI